MFKVLILDKLYLPMLELIRENAPADFEIAIAEPTGTTAYEAQLSQADFIMTISEYVNEALLEKAKNLKLVHLWGVGFDKIDVAACKARGIPVARTTGANSISVAEHAIMLMLAVYRKLVKADTLLRSGAWPRWELRMSSYELYHKKVGIVGFGQIGQHVARRLKGFETETYYYDIFTQTPEKEKELGVKGNIPLDELLTTCDVITLHCPLTDETEKMMNTAMFKRMKSTSILINCARGAIVNEADLYEALKKGEILGAGLDVFDGEPIKAGNPLITLDNVILLPHLAAATRDTSAAMARILLGNMARISQGNAIDPFYLV